MQTRAETRDTNRLTDILLFVLVLGSLWGFSEVVLSGAIRSSGLPFRAGILTGLGIGLVAVALGAFRKPLVALFIPLIAVLCKQLVVPILGASVMCKMNSCVAVILEGFALTGVAYLAGHTLTKKRPVQMVTGASGALVAAGIFYFVGMRLAPCNYLLSFNRANGFISFMAAEGLVWAGFSAVFFPLGYWIGERLRNTELSLARKSLVYYVIAAVLFVGSWVTSAVVTATGF